MFETKSALIAFSHHYFQLTQNCLNEMIKSGNKNYLYSDYSENSTDDDYLFDEQTKWSDYKVLIPVLFNFYHSLELLMKGIILLKCGESKNDHDLEKLYSQMANLNLASPLIIQILKKYCAQNKHETNPISTFLKANNTTSSKFYIFLKYPFNNNTKFDYSSLRHLYGKGDVIANELLTDIDIIKTNIISI